MYCTRRNYKAQKVVLPKENPEKNAIKSILYINKIKTRTKKVQCLEKGKQNNVYFSICIFKIKFSKFFLYVGINGFTIIFFC